MTIGEDIAQKLRRSLNFLVGATVVLYIVMIGGIAWVYFANRKTNDALCAFRDNLTRQVLQSTAYLKEHPKGTPGLPAKALLTSIGNQQRTIVALKDLSCPTPKDLQPPAP